MIGKRLSHFRVLGKIGEGGMGVVYRAEDENLSRPVALKVLHPEFVADEERRQRFMREARTAAAVSHHNIATVHEIDEVDGTIFIAMELVEGRTLAAELDGKPMAFDDVLRLAIQMADGLARAHQSSIVHRDLKPENIIVTPEGRAKILDFGLAKLFHDGGPPFDGDGASRQTVSAEVTREGKILGTVAYMSPEQARGVDVDCRSDLFAFGVVLYEMVTGKAPFKGETMTDTLTAILRDTPLPLAEFNPDVPSEFERILSRCIEKDPDDRYQDAGELVTELRTLKSESDSHSLPRVSLPGVVRPRVPLWRRPVTVMLAMGLFAALAYAAPRIVRTITGLSARAPVNNSLAVLPFRNLQDVEDPARVGQILQELIITDLSENASLRVFSSQRLLDIQNQLGRKDVSSQDPGVATEVAKKVGAGAMLTGTLSQLDSRWILTGHLVDPADGTVLKSAGIEGTDLYAMVDDLTAQIRKNIGTADVAQSLPDLAVKDRTSSSLEAYQHYLGGVDLLNALDYHAAAEELERAVYVDPTFGRAYFKLAIARWWDAGIDEKSDSGGAGPGEVLENLLASDVKLQKKDRRLSEAFLALVRNRWADARDLFQEIVEDYPDEKEAWYGLGESIYHLEVMGGSAVESLAAFDRAVDLDPGFRLSYRHIFDVLSHEKRYDEAIERAQRLVRSAPDDLPLYGYWINANVHKGQIGEAERLLQVAARHTAGDHETAQLYAQVAESYRRIEHFARARELGRQALTLDPQVAGKVFMVQMGWTAFLSSDVADARHWFGQELQARPQNGEARMGLIRLEVLEGQPDRAFELAERWLAEDPESPRAQSAVIETAIRSGELERAEGLYNEAIVSFPETMRRELTSQTAVSYLLSGVPDKAEGLARLALDETPQGKNSQLFMLLGWSLALQDRLDEAESAFQRGVDADPTGEELLAARSTVELLKGDADAAEQILRDALPAGPVHASTMAHLACVLAEQGRYREAEPLARRAAEMAPGRRSASVLSWILIAGELNLDEGMALARSALVTPKSYYDPVQVAPYMPSPEHSLGLAYLKRGDHAEAAKFLRDAARKRPQRKLIQEHLDQALAPDSPA